MQINNLISVKRADLEIVYKKKKKKKRKKKERKKSVKKKKRTCLIVDFAVPADHRLKIKENENRNKFLYLNKKTTTKQQKQKNKTKQNMEIYTKWIMYKPDSVQENVTTKFSGTLRSPNPSEKTRRSDNFKKTKEKVNLPNRKEY